MSIIKVLQGRICCRAQSCFFNCHCYNYSDFPVWPIGSFASAIRTVCLSVVLTIKWEKWGSFKGRGEKRSKSHLFSLIISEGILPPLALPCSPLFVNNRNRNLSFIYSICGASVLSCTFCCGFGAGKQLLLGYCGIFFYPWQPVIICKKSNLSELCRSWVTMTAIPGLKHGGHCA